LQREHLRLYDELAGADFMRDWVSENVNVEHYPTEDSSDPEAEATG
jgi:hypothetical protein